MRRCLVGESESNPSVADVHFALLGTSCDRILDFTVGDDEVWILLDPFPDSPYIERDGIFILEGELCIVGNDGGPWYFRHIAYNAKTGFLVCPDPR